MFTSSRKPKFGPVFATLGLEHLLWVEIGLCVAHECLLWVGAFIEGRDVPGLS